MMAKSPMLETVAKLQRGRARAGAECWHTWTRPRPANRASTGPRPRGRGMWDPQCVLAAKYILLQRGRARAGAECTTGPVLKSGLNELQRGRARAGAECGRRRPRKNQQSESFNGAAPARARNGSSWPSARPSQCFNGAAPARARNAPPSSAKQLEPPRFNGAAPARARNGEEWSRCQNEIPASTGPRPRGRGMVMDPEYVLAPPWLQRGRARAGAEWSPIGPSTARARSRFNGAAPARARNDYETRDRQTPITALQRGRARAGAEWSGRIAFCIGHRRLQRGRARAGAE